MAKPGRDRQQPFVRFGADGAWSGSDGCNGIGGQYVLGPAGQWLPAAGGQTAVGCDNAPFTGWVGAARSAGFDGATLVLLDEHAHELGRLTHHCDRACQSQS